MISELMSDSWSLFKAQFGVIMAIALPVVIPSEIFVTYYEYTFLDEQSSFLETLAPIAVVLPLYTLYTAALIFFISSAVSERKLAIGEAWEMGLKAWMPYLLLNIVVILICGLGLVALVVPGVYLALKFAFAGFEMLLHDHDLKASLALSWKRTDGYKGKMFAGGAIVFAIFYLPYATVSNMIDPAGKDYIVFYTIGNVLFSIVGIYLLIYVFRVYWLAGEQHNKSLNTDTGSAGAG